MSIKKFMTIDLLIMSLVAIVLDLTSRLLPFFGLNSLIISFTVPIILLMYIRWGKYALVPNVVLAISHSLVFGLVNVNKIDFINIIGSFAGVMILPISLLLIKYIPKEKIKNDFYKRTMFFMGIYILMVLTQFTIVYLLKLGFSPQINYSGKAFIALIIQHTLNILLCWFIFGMIARQKDLMVDMKQYLYDQAKEKQRKKEEKI